MCNDKYPQSPCHHCADKKMGCHTGCVKYLAYCVVLDGYKAEIKKKKDFENQMNGLEVNRGFKRAKAANLR